MPFVPQGVGNELEYWITAHIPLVADIADRYIFIAPTRCTVTQIQEIHATAESTATTLLMNVTRCQGTEAPSAGDPLIADNTAAGLSLKATAATLQTATLTSTTAHLTLEAGDRLAFDSTQSGSAANNFAGGVFLIKVRVGPK